MNQKIPFDQLDEDIQQEYIEKAYYKMVDSAHIIMLDDPMEDHPSFDWVCEVAQEMYEEEDESK